MAATLTEPQIEARRKGARTLNSPELLALRLSRAWPDMDDRQREVIGGILGPLVMLRSPVDLVCEKAGKLTEVDKDRLLDAVYGEDRVR
jgi:hypothetical protein